MRGLRVMLRLRVAARCFLLLLPLLFLLHCAAVCCCVICFVACCHAAWPISCSYCSSIS